MPQSLEEEVADGQAQDHEAPENKKVHGAAVGFLQELGLAEHELDELDDPLGNPVPAHFLFALQQQLNPVPGAVKEDAGQDQAEDHLQDGKTDSASRN